MYKKRFTKWGFYKNTRRTPAQHSSPSTEPDDSVAQHLTLGRAQQQLTQLWLISTPGTSRPDMVLLMFLTNIRTWCTTFYDTLRASDRASMRDTSKLSLYLPQNSKAKPYAPESISTSFKLVADLLLRGQGILAGRLARKAFLQVEQMLQLEGPLFIWNLLEILHSVMGLRQTRLYEMLITHLIGLARSHYVDGHASVQLLRGLLLLTKTSADNSAELLPAILEQGWSLNADVVLSNFSERFLLLYYRLMWNSGLLKLTEEKLQDADTWFSLVKYKIPMEKITAGAIRLHSAVDFMPSNARRVPPANYELIKTQTIAELHQRATMEVPESNTRFRVLSALLKSRVLNERVDLPNPSDTGDSDDMDDNSLAITSTSRPKVTRLHSRILAYLLTALTDIDQEYGASEDTLIQRMKNTITLREYGEGFASPQVIADMRRLRNILMLKGRVEEAIPLGQEAEKRLEMYLRDIPVDTVKEMV